MEQREGVPTWQAWRAVADDEARWQDHEERGLLKVEHVRDFVLRLWFEEELDVSIYEMDFAPLFRDANPGGVFAPLADGARFALARGDYALIWPDPDSGEVNENAVDLAPECVRFFCESYGTLLKAAGATPQRVAA